MADRPDLVIHDPRGGPDLRLAWWSEIAGPPAAVRAVDDRITAAEALRRTRSGEALAWMGDWHNGRQLLSAMGRRLPDPAPRGSTPLAAFRAERERKRVEHSVLSRLAVPVGPGWQSPLRRAPPLDTVLGEAFGAPPERTVLIPMREVLGAIGAHEWFRRGVPVPALGGTVHPRYGVFAPVRGEYVDLVAQAIERRRAALGLDCATAFDVGTGTGVLAILLARAGARVVATDIDPRAVTSARENAARFHVADRVEVIEADAYPPGRARVVVANPPWIPEQAHGPLDRAVYDPGGRVLERVVSGLRDHLVEGGEGWLVLSDLAERVGLRPEGFVPALVATTGLSVVTVLSAKATHRRARSGAGPLAAARAAETTRVYVIKA